MRRSGDYLERVSDHEFHVRAVACPDLELREESSAVLSAHEDVESPFDLGVVTPSTVTVVVEAHDVQRGAGSDIDRPRIVVERNLVGKLQVERDEDPVTAHPDFGVRAKDQPVQEGSGFEMTPEKELVRIPADANPDADLFLCRTRTSERENENGCANEGTFDVHTRCNRFVCPEASGRLHISSLPLTEPLPRAPRKEKGDPERSPLIDPRKPPIGYFFRFRYRTPTMARPVPSRRRVEGSGTLVPSLA